MQNSRLQKFVTGRLSVLAFLSVSASFITGCGASFVSTVVPAGPAAHPAIYGKLHGGQQPVAGASIQLYAAGAPAMGGGYGEGSVPLLLGTLPVTDRDGNFTITGDYVAPLTPSFFYIVANGGSPGFGTPINPNITMMTTIGGCTPTVGLSPSTSVEINEVTTAASAMALQQYLAPPALANIFSPAIGAPSTDIIGLQNAFQAVNNLVNTGTGVVVDPSVDAYATADNGLLLNTMGNILASCINSAPLLDTSCSQLYADATPGFAFPAFDSQQASSYMAQNPTNNVSTLYSLITSTAPFVGYPTAPDAFAVNLANAHSSCQALINLNSLDHFELLAGSTITAAAGGLTTITGGDLGLSPGTAVSGFPPAVLTTPAVMYLTDPIAAQAQLDLGTVYQQVAGLAGAAPLPADISGYILPPGLYSSTATLAYNTDITLDAQGDPNAQFIFQVASGLNTGLGTHIILLNGAQAKNVFWQIRSSAVLGHDSVFEGSIFAYASITLNIDVVVHGRALASNGAVTMSGNNTVVAP
jgi:hypothetical protein